jgi:hypothetical protein
VTEGERDYFVAKIAELEYRRDRYKMNGDAAADLAEYRMYRIFELEAELERLKSSAPVVQR